LSTNIRFTVLPRIRLLEIRLAQKLIVNVNPRLAQGDYESSITGFSAVIEADPRETTMEIKITDIVLNSNFYRSYAYNELDMRGDAKMDLDLLVNTHTFQSYLLELDEVVDKTIINFNRGWTTSHSAYERYYGEASDMCRESVKGNFKRGSNFYTDTTDTWRSVDCTRWLGEATIPSMGHKPFTEFPKQADWKTPFDSIPEGRRPYVK